MYTEESKVLPFNCHAQAHGANADVLRVLAAALQHSTPMDAPASNVEGDQEIKGDWNVQVIAEKSAAQRILGSHNVQICCAKVHVHVNVRVNHL